MKRFMTSMVAALAIFAISNAAQAGNPGGHGHEDGRRGDGMMRRGNDYHNDYRIFHEPRHEYGCEWKGWSKRFYCNEYGCNLYWCEDCRWWYRYDEREGKYRPLSEEYRPNHERK